MSPDTTTWTFTQRTDERTQTWSWRRSVANGSSEAASAEYPCYAAAVMDAVQKGFKPKTDYHVVEWAGRIVHFRPGQPPVAVSAGTGSRLTRSARRAAERTGGAYPGLSVR
jgi:hypothetical protein